MINNYDVLQNRIRTGVLNGAEVGTASHYKTRDVKCSPCMTHPNKIFSNIIFLCLTRIGREMIVKGINSSEQIFCLLIIRGDNACIK